MSMTDAKAVPTPMLPCPFCGGESRVVGYTRQPDIRCSNRECGLYIFSLTMEMWNRRVDTAALTTEREAHEATKRELYRLNHWTPDHTIEQWLAEVTAQRDKAESALRQSQEALRKYGNHRFGCPVMTGTGACNCGLQEALSPTDEGAKPDLPVAMFEDAARPLIQLLNENVHPHHTAIVTPTGAELLEGQRSTGQVLDYVKD